MRYRQYELLSSALDPLIYGWLRLRLWRGKEDKARFAERHGRASIPRPPGTLVWFHAASVGEANSVLPMIEQLLTRFPAMRVLITTGTVTSAQLVKARAPKGVIHQYVPVDTPEATKRFLRHWKPDIGLWVESEFWPNLVINARKRGCFMVIINGRMSTRSYERWQRFAPVMMYDMLACFEVSFAQSEADAQRLRGLGAKDVRCVGNVKFDADLLPCNEADLLALQTLLENRPLWLAASTHEGEETQLLQTHQLLAATRPNLLTIIVPRHPQRGADIAKQLMAHGGVALRSRGEKPTGHTAFYIADTLGELGLFYRLSEIVFMGGSLVKHGGQNPLEPARLRCTVLTGPHTYNFADIVAEMEAHSIITRVQNAAALAGQIDRLLRNPDQLTKSQALTRQWLQGKGGAAKQMLDILAPIFVPLDGE